MSTHRILPENCRKSPIITIIILLFIFLSPIVTLKSNNDSLKYTLSDLDKYIADKTIFEEQKNRRIHKLENEFRNALQNKEKYDICSNLFHQYEVYNFDKAYYYAEKMVELAQLMNDNNKIIESELLMVYCTLSAGLFLESNEILKTIDLDTLSPEHKIFYYSMCAKLNLDMASSMIPEPYTSNYYKKSIEYSNFLINILGNNNDALLQKVNIHRCSFEYDKAIQDLQKYMNQEKKLTERSFTLCMGSIGQFHLLKGDTISAIPYLCYTAINDIKSVTKETPSLSLLAGILYNQGDINRAYTYAKCALDDANFYNARHRKIEVGNVLPIIESSRFEIIEHQRSRLFVYSIAVSVLVVILVAATIAIWLQIKRLRAARRLIKQQNNELLNINNELKEANKIKDEYIGHFFSNNSIFIDKIENLLKIMSRKIAARQYDDMNQYLMRFNIQKEKEDSLIAFDHIFLSIFPDFVKQFNNLFEDKNKINVHAESALPTEVRIFALIRLGVTDSERIAKLLNYSVNTINTYKTKIKNRSQVPNEQFEKYIMKIESRKKA